MSDTKVYRASTTAPVNIAVVKYVLGIGRCHEKEWKTRDE